MTRNISILVASFVILIFVVTSFVAPRANTQNLTVVQPQQVQWEYARLAIADNLASFQAGETNVPTQVFSLEVLYRRLGGSSRTNLTNLLNQIGRDGWELVSVSTDEANWTFKRRNR